MSESLKVNFGKKVAELRKKKHLTQSDLAGLSKLSLIGISQIERGQKFASENTIINLCSALDCEVADLFNFSLKQALSQEERKKLEDINNLLENHPELISKTLETIFCLISK